jgi:cadmium resistance protein CadD (predicted permease)
MRRLVEAISLFAVTNVDDLVVLSLFFGWASTRRDRVQVVLGQYVGFALLLVLSVVGAAGATLLPDGAVRWLGLVPLALGVVAGWQTLRERRARRDEAEETVPRRALGWWAVAGVTFANGGDNLGVYIPAFAQLDRAAVASFVAIFLCLVALWCAMAVRIAGHPRVAAALDRWGDVLYPAALVAIGVVLLVSG